MLIDAQREQFAEQVDRAGTACAIRKIKRRTVCAIDFNHELAAISDSAGTIIQLAYVVGEGDNIDSTIIIVAAIVCTKCCSSSSVEILITKLHARTK